MELYIHVPFCKQKCLYCGFYSEPLGISSQGALFDTENEQLSKQQSAFANGQNALLPSDIGINLFSAQKKRVALEAEERLIRDIIQRKFDGANTQHLAEDVLKNFGQGLSAENDGQDLKKLSVFHVENKTDKKTQSRKKKLLNSSKAFGTHPVGVQSLADILKSQKETHITEEQPQKVRGATLGDAFLSKEQAHDLRQSFGFSSVIDSDRVQENVSQKKSAKEKGSGHKEEAQYALQSMRSFIAGDSSGFVDINTANDYVRIAQNGHNIHADEMPRMSVPRALPDNFQEKNALAENSYYQLWKKTLLAEIKVFAQNYAKVSNNEMVTSIFFGGGTPSYIPVRDINLILRTLIKHFPVIKKAEITLEANPESITLEKAQAYLYSGFNRVSLGVQSLQDDNLQRLGRAHSATSAIKAFHILREARFNNISIDLMWGLPNQKNRNWRSDIKEAINLAPEHISCYGLSIDEDTFFSELEEKGELSLPDEKEQALMYRTCVDLLEDAGYLQYEISNFSKMGFQCQHNMGYWQGDSYIGFGPSAASTVAGIRRTHARSLLEWAKDVQYGYANAQNFTPYSLGLEEKKNTKSLAENSKNISGMPVQEKPYFTKEILSQQDKVLECIMLRLRTSKGLEFIEYKNLTGRSFMNDHKSLIQTLINKNLVRVKKGSISLSTNGMLISNSILEHFFERTKKIIEKLV